MYKYIIYTRVLKKEGENMAGNFEQKSCTRQKALDYAAFGWQRTNVPVPMEDLGKASKKNQPEVVLRRKLDYAYDPTIKSCEQEYLKRDKKRYRQLPILGIIFFLLFLACFVLTVGELWVGISNGLKVYKEAKPAEEESAEDVKAFMIYRAEEAPATDAALEEGDEEESKSIIETIEGYIVKVNDDYLKVVLDLFRGKETSSEEATEEPKEDSEGIADKLGGMIGEPVSYFISAETLVGVIALILFIVFLIIFCSIAKRKKKRAKNEAIKEELKATAAERVNVMRHSDLSLMSKAERKQYMWTRIISDAIIRANGGEGDEED